MDPETKCARKADIRLYDNHRAQERQCFWPTFVLSRRVGFLVLAVDAEGSRHVQLLTRQTARLLAGNQRLQRWCFDVELIYVAQKLGIPIAEVPVNWTEIPGEPSPPLNPGAS